MPQAERHPGRRLRLRGAVVAGILVVWLVYLLCADVPRALSDRSAANNSCFSQLPRIEPRRGRGLQAAQQSDQQTSDRKKAADADMLGFETAKFNVMWTKMKEAEEATSPHVEELRKELEEQGSIVEKLGGSLPADMLTQEQAQAKAAALTADLNFEKLLSMSNQERWVLAQSLGPAFPISLVLSYTGYWALNVPFISYAYFTTVVTGQTTMPVVMAGFYATSIPFKPFIYIGAILAAPWTAENVMPLVGKVFGIFKLPDESDWDRLSK